MFDEMKLKWKQDILVNVDTITYIQIRLHLPTIFGWCLCAVVYFSFRVVQMYSTICVQMNELNDGINFTVPLYVSVFVFVYVVCALKSHRKRQAIN